LLCLHADKDEDEGAVATQQSRPIKLKHLDGLTEGLVAVSSDNRKSLCRASSIPPMATGKTL
jgi:hypothetical protein